MLTKFFIAVRLKTCQVRCAIAGKRNMGKNMKKFPIDIEVDTNADGLKLEALGVHDTQALDEFVQTWRERMKETFMHGLVDAYETDKTLDFYSNVTAYRHRAKKSAEYVMTRAEDDGEREIVGYFNLQIKNGVGETFAWVAPSVRGNHILHRALKIVEQTFFPLGLKSIKSQCYFKNSFFPIIHHILDKSGYKAVEENSASVVWEKTYDMWRLENERGVDDRTDNKNVPEYDDNIGRGLLTLKTLEPMPENAEALFKLAQSVSAVEEGGYRPSCLNVDCLNAALYALQSADKLRKEGKFCEYFVYVGDEIVGTIALREEKINDADKRLNDFSASEPKRKASVLYWMRPDKRGKGYTGESLMLAAASFFSHGGDLLSLDIYPNNYPSLKVAQKADFKYNDSVGHYLTRASFEKSAVICYKSMLPAPKSVSKPSGEMLNSKYIRLRNMHLNTRF